MASINKLSIRGIRSFSPERDEVIEFSRPLTLIVGQNGCGKTTIVECLKFLSMGSLPPGSRSGQSFINDPTMTDSTEVKGAIKMKFTNKAGESSMVSRSLMISRKRSKMEFKQLDGASKVVSHCGEEVSLSHKCSDLDKHVPELLGVSSAILENVIFLHQEDSSWPLQEGATLKKKFDDIFDSTRYTKALEAITKAKKEYTSKSKDLKVDVMESGAHLMAANDLRKTADACREKEDACHRDLEEVDTKLESVREKIERYSEMLRKTQAAESELTELKWSHDALVKSIAEKERRLDHVHTESTLELHRLLDDFESKMSAKVASLRQLTASLDAHGRELADLRSELMQWNSKRGEAVSLKTQLDRQITVLLDFMQEASRRLDVSYRSSSAETGSIETTKRQSAAFLEQLERKIASIQADNKVSIDAAGADVTAREKELMDVRSAVQKARLELDLKEKELKRINSERATLRYTQTKFASAKSDLVVAKGDYDSAVAALEEHCHGGRVNESVLAFQTQLAGITEELRKLTELIARNQTILEDVSSMRAEYEKVAAQHAQLETESALCTSDVGVFIDNCGADRLFDFSTLSGLECKSHGDTVRYSALMQEQCKAKKAETVQRGSELREIRNNLAHVGALVTQDSATMAQLDKEISASNAEKAKLKDLVDELNAVRVALDPDSREMPVVAFDVRNCSGRELDRLTEEAEKTSGSAVEMSLMVDSATMFYAKFESARKKTNACPCCSKVMDASEVAAYDQKLRRLLKVNRRKEEMEELKGRSAVMGDKLKAVVAVLKTVLGKQQQADALKSQIREYQDQKSGLLMQETDVEGKLKAAETQLGLMDRGVIELEHLTKKWENCGTRLSELGQKRSRLQTQMQNTASMYEVASGASAGASMAGGTAADMGNYHEALESEIKEYTRQKEVLQARKDSVKEEESRFTKKNFALKSNLAEKEKVLAEKQQNSDKYAETVARLAELDTAIKDIEQGREEQTRSIAPLQATVKDHETAVATAKTALSQLEQRLNESVSQVKNDEDSCRRLLNMVVDLAARQQDVASIDTELSRTQEAIEGAEQSIKDTTPRRDALNKELNSQEQTKKIVQDNLDLRECIADRDKKAEQIRRLEEKLRGDGVSGSSSGSTREDMQRELQRAEQSKQKLGNERASLSGRVIELTDQILDIETKLGNASYKNIDEKYKRKMIEYETTLVALTDLDSYFSTLDSALANFHSLKVQEINKIIRELWQYTYKGEDIDQIEIQSGDDTSDGAVSTLAKAGSRSYNYRVVMRKANVPLDMRGRCSAGQRVLAALVIRLALAETFCLNCGILALDEPTTNLDEANKAGLAYSLARIIANRSRQSNFQLICITHDEDFVRMMNTEMSALTNFSLPEYFFRVKRVEDQVHRGKYFSSIERVSWEDV